MQVHVQGQLPHDGQRRRRADQGRRQAGEVIYHTHRPRPGDRLRDQRRQDVSPSPRKRSSFGQDILLAAAVRRDLTTGQVSDAEGVHQARWRARRSRSTSATPTTATSRRTRPACCRSGRKGVDPRPAHERAPASFEWRGFLKPAQHPQAVNPRDGQLVNWNNKPAPASRRPTTSSATARSIACRCSTAGSPKRAESSTCAGDLGAMNAAATQDLRDVLILPVIKAVLRQGACADARDAQMLALLDQWRAPGRQPAGPQPRRPDRRPGRGRSWTRSTAGGPRSRWSPRSAPRSRTSSAAHEPQQQPQAAASRAAGTPTSTRTCARCWVAACRGRYRRPLLRSGRPAPVARPVGGRRRRRATSSRRTAGPRPGGLARQRHGRANHFAPGLLPTTIRYTNRPTGDSAGRHVQRPSVGRARQT